VILQDTDNYYATKFTTAIHYGSVITVARCVLTSAVSMMLEFAVNVYICIIKQTSP